MVLRTKNVLFFYKISFIHNVNSDDYLETFNCFRLSLSFCPLPPTFSPLLTQSLSEGRNSRIENVYGQLRSKLHRSKSSGPVNAPVWVFPVGSAPRELTTVPRCKPPLSPSTPIPSLLLHFFDLQYVHACDYFFWCKGMNKSKLKPRRS